MYSVEFWKRFDSRTEYNGAQFKTVIADSFVYKISKSDNPQLNSVMYVDAKNIKDIFQEINEIYKEKKMGFSVYVRDTDSRGITEYLENSGYELKIVQENRVLALNETTINSLKKKVNDQYKTIEISREELDENEIYELYKACFPELIKSKEGYDSVNTAMYEMADKMGSEIRNYIMYDERPIAFGSLFDMGEFEGRHIAMLSGAGTLKEYRNNNLYSTMLYQRCVQAMKIRIDTLFVNANQATSATIVAKYGFKLIDCTKVFFPKE